MGDFFLKLRGMKAYGTVQPDPPKKRVPIAKQSAKKKAQLKAEKPERGDLANWFKAVRTKLVGTCQCGCGNTSSKNDDINYKSSCCHIFPKSIFKSVRTHPLNYVERNFWEGCHTNMDNQTLDKWPNMADWDDIKEKFYILAPLLTDKERRHKFYKHLERLVYKNADALIPSENAA